MQLGRFPLNPQRLRGGPWEAWMGLAMCYTRSTATISLEHDGWTCLACTAPTQPSLCVITNTMGAPEGEALLDMQGCGIVGNKTSN